MTARSRSGRASLSDFEAAAEKDGFRFKLWRGERMASWAWTRRPTASSASRWRCSIPNPGAPDFDRDDTTQWAVGYEFVHDFSPSVSLVQNARYMRLDVDYRQLYLADPLPELGPGWYGRSPYFLDETNTAFTIDARVTAAVTTGALAHDLLAGFDYRTQKTTNDTDYLYGEGPPIDLFDPVYGAHVVGFPRSGGETDRIENTGLYLQDQIQAGCWFAIGDELAKVRSAGAASWAKREAACFECRMVISSKSSTPQRLRFWQTAAGRSSPCRGSSPRPRSSRCRIKPVAPTAGAGTGGKEWNFSWALTCRWTKAASAS